MFKYGWFIIFVVYLFFCYSKFGFIEICYVKEGLIFLTIY